MKKNKISFCTVCMNRLHHLKQTLLQNIQDNVAYGEVEFLVFDYNSTDGLEDWIKTEMLHWVEQGVLVYYKTSVPKYFNRSHSRNVMFKLASGDIICNIDADNFTGEGFADYINKAFTSDENIFVIPDTKKNFYYIRDALGRFCAWKKDFLQVRGYDEDMSGYGFEDDDLYKRLELLGRNEKIIMDLKYLKAIQHNNAERVSNEFYASNIKNIYIHYINYKQSEVIFLYKDFSYEMGEIYPNNLNTPSPLLIKNNVWLKGSWKEENDSIVVENENGLLHLKEDSEFNLKGFDKIYYKVTTLNFLENVTYELSIIKNMGKYLLNQQDNNAHVNNTNFGKEVVVKDFSKELITV